ncbi:hypothetical protein DFH09DRAFT_1073096 [Mycena vulgaris]|nr:hypothetical protein DFH09DRAFT_1073096 [Mycena vulgaris]
MATAPRLKLDTLTGPQVQDARKWALLVDEACTHCVKTFPALNDFARALAGGALLHALAQDELPEEGEDRARDSTAAPPEGSRASGAQELNSKKRKEHPDPGRGEKENVSVDARTTTPTQTPAASQSRIAPSVARVETRRRRNLFDDASRRRWLHHVASVSAANLGTQEFFELDR